jgi:hypothetical protein
MPEKYIIHWFPSCSGGLCDKILGLCGTLCIAKLLNRKILILWECGDLSPNLIVKDKYNFYKNWVHFRNVNMNNFESIEYFKTHDIIKEWGEDNILIWSNMNLYNYILQNPYFANTKQHTRVIDYSESLKEILFEYLHINPKILENYKEYDVGIHIRTGDKQIYNKENEEFYKEYITNIFKKIKDEGSIQETDSIFVSSDCLLTIKIASEFFNKFHYNEGEIVHTGDTLTNDGVFKVLLDFINLCKCKSKMYLGWHSNFSRVSALFNPDRKFICYEYENNPNNVKIISSDILFEYFSWGKYT